MEKSMPSKCVMITGCNRGIGLGLFEEILKDPSVGTVIAAIRRLDSMDLSKYSPIEGHQKHLKKLEMDLSKEESIESCLSQLKKENLKVDVLINNAAFMPLNNKVVNPEIATKCIETNFLGTLKISESIIQQEILIRGGKIIQISSSLGKYDRLMGKKPKTEILNALKNPSRDIEDLISLAKKYLNDVFENKTHVWGWPTSAYAVSKMMLNSYTQILGRECIGKKIQVYACCPGWVKTESTAHTNAKRTVEEGIKGIMELYRKEEMKEEEQGGFYAEGTFEILEKM